MKGKTPRRKSHGFRPVVGKTYRCALCEGEAKSSQFCYGCRYFVCSHCEAHSSIASMPRNGHTLQDHRTCAGCLRKVTRGGMGSVLRIEPDFDEKYTDNPEPEVESRAGG